MHNLRFDAFGLKGGFGVSGLRGSGVCPECMYITVRTGNPSQGCQVAVSLRGPSLARVRAQCLLERVAHPRGTTSRSRAARSHGSGWGLSWGRGANGAPPRRVSTGSPHELLHAGAEANHVDTRGISSLTSACFARGDHVELVQLLLEAKVQGGKFSKEFRYLQALEEAPAML